MPPHLPGVRGCAVIDEAASKSLKVDEDDLKKDDAKDPAVKEAGSKDADVKGVDQKEVGTKESNLKVPSSKEPSSHASDSKESGSKEPISKESGANGPSPKESTTKEPISKQPALQEVGHKADLKATDPKEVDQKIASKMVAGLTEKELSHQRFAARDKGGQLIACLEISGPPVVPQKIVTRGIGGQKIASRMDTKKDDLSDEDSSDEIDAYERSTDVTKYIKPHVTLRDRLEKYHAPQKFI